MRIAMIGATGLIGRALAPLLVARHDVLLIGRRAAGVAGAEELIGATRDWPSLLSCRTVDVAISTLGTTWKQAGNWDAFRAVDHHAVVAFAGAAKVAGARQFMTVSSVGADPAARAQYLALKGEVERDLAAIGFERLDIVRPGLLRGDRGTERRLGERIGIMISPLANLLMRGSLDKFAAIDADRVAAAMAPLIGADKTGQHVHFNRDLNALASQAIIGN